MNYYIPRNPSQEIQEICQRVEKLLLKEKARKETLRYLASLLYEAGMANDIRVDSVPEFVLDLEESLKQLDPNAIHWPTSPLRSYETAEEMILGVIPGSLE